MARIGRSQPIQPSVRGRLAFHRSDVALPVFESVSEWPALTVTTPNVDLSLPAFESISEWPALGLTYEQSFALAVFESPSEWPALSVEVPVKPGDSLTGARGEAEWNGTLWGPTTGVRVLLPVDGWLGTPNIDNLNVEKPNDHGAWDARKLAQQRIVTLRLQANSASDPTAVDDLLEQVIAATGIPESEDPLPLVIKGFGAPRLAYGQVVDRPLVMDGDYNAGLPTIGVLIACGDARLYGLDPRGATVALNTPTALSNAGNASTHPLIRLKGPLTNPTLANQTLGRVLEFAITVPAGQTLEIDTKNGTATQAGVNKMSALTGVSDPVTDFVLAAGSNSIQYTTTADGTNGADMTWRDATI